MDNTIKLYSLWVRSPDLSGAPSDGWKRWHHQHTSCDPHRLIERAQALGKTYPDHAFAVARVGRDLNA